MKTENCLLITFLDKLNPIINIIIIYKISPKENGNIDDRLLVKNEKY